MYTVLQYQKLCKYSVTQTTWNEKAQRFGEGARNTKKNSGRATASVTPRQHAQLYGNGTEKNIRGMPIQTIIIVTLIIITWVRTLNMEYENKLVNVKTTTVH